MIEIDAKHIQFIIDHQFDDIRQLALQSSRYKDIDMPFVLKQIEGLQIARKKIPSWYDYKTLLYPIHLSLEQCSSQYTAIYKASLCTEGNILIDLTGGFGVDFAFMSFKYQKAYYIEQQPELVELAKHNFKILGLNNVEFINDNSLSFLSNFSKKASTIFIDPARRDYSGSKTVSIQDCTPNVAELDTLLNNLAIQCIIKLSPMLDISQALNSLSNITDIHVVSVNNECKELLFIKTTEQKKVEIHCVNIMPSYHTNIFSFYKDQEYDLKDIAYTDNIDLYLYEPNSSILKAGAYKTIAQKYNLSKLHPNSHLYTSNEYIKDFPGRVFLVEEAFSLTKKNTSKLSNIIPKANITVRNYPLSVAEIRKQTKIKEGGEKYIFATTLINEKKVLILGTKLSA